MSNCPNQFWSKFDFYDAHIERGEIVEDSSEEEILHCTLTGYPCENEEGKYPWDCVGVVRLNTKCPHCAETMNPAPSLLEDGHRTIFCGHCREIFGKETNKKRGKMLTVLNFGEKRVAFFNGTPHAINLIAGAVFDPLIRKAKGGEEIAEIPSSGILLSAKLSTSPTEYLGKGVTIAQQVVKSCDELPDEAKEADYIIVSALYASAYRQLHGEDGTPLVTIRDLVVAEDGKTPRGCAGFALA